MKVKEMLSKLLPILLVLCIHLSGHSQAPQGFSYQAVIRNASGTPMASQSIKVHILLTNQLGTVTHYGEEHTLTTTPQGVANLTIGNGSSKVGTLAAVPWQKGEVYIKVEADPTGTSSYQPMGNPVKLTAVPYALFAENAKEVVSPEGAADTDPIFVVKNKAGQIVFAVYQTGVRVYVSDTSKVKGAKGGFAVGGFTSKSITDAQDYFTITPSSARIWFDDQGKGAKGGFAVGGFTSKATDPAEYFSITPDSARIMLNNHGKGAKGGFAVGGFTSKGNKANYFNVETNNNIVINPSEPRILWYPLKNAFLTGQVLIEHPDSVGTNSFASGYQSKAKGQYSQALGYQAIARGVYSTSIGYQSVAHKDNSFAVGQWAQARNLESYAFGRGAIAGGFRSYAFGSAGIDSSGSVTGVTYAKGDYSFAIGQGSQTLGYGSFAIGIADTAKGPFSIALGYQTASKGWYATSIGYKTEASGETSTAMGYNTLASGSHSTAMGTATVASGFGSTAMGYTTYAIGRNSFASGNLSAASGDESTALGLVALAPGKGSLSSGYYSIADGDFSQALGYQSYSTGKYSTSIGYYTRAVGESSLAMGAYSKAEKEYSSTIGYYAHAYESYSTALGTYATAYGKYSSALSSQSYAISAYETVVGSFNTFYTPLSKTDWNPADRLFVVGNGSDIYSQSDAFTILKNGKVGIGTSTPDQKFVVFNGTTTGRYTTTGWTHVSDIRLKENVIAISNVLSDILKLQGVRFNFINDKAKTQQIGFIAQDFEKVFPEFVVIDNDGYKSIAYGQITSVLVEAVKEQQKQINTLKEENALLKTHSKEIEILKAELEAIKALLRK